MIFGERLKLLRNERSLTQEDIAEILNVGRPTIAGYETKGKEHAIKKYNLTGNDFSARCIDASSYNINLNNKKLIIWSDKEAISLINNNFTDDIGMVKINLNNIISFSRYGDFFTTLKSHINDDEFTKLKNDLLEKI